MPSRAAALSYREPDIVTILILCSFLLLQNAVNWAFDRILFCGLIGQIIIGVAWGTPGTNWLPQDVQSAIMQIGYLGLILLVFEGGLATDLKTLKSNLLLSSIVAVVGVSATMALSFALPGFVGSTTPLQAFAAGAALCSTSLGTTFTILSTSGLNASRLGVVLSSAAMMDDIVGLVMSGIISSLGKSSSAFSAITVIRPVFVSVAFAICVPLICLWIVTPLTNFCFTRIDTGSRLHSWIATEGAALCLHALVLSGLVAGSSFAGTSVLFAAYLAGAAITWWDGLCKNLRRSAPTAGHTTRVAIPQSTSDSVRNDPTAAPRTEAGREPSAIGPANDNQASTASAVQPDDDLVTLSGSEIFEKYYAPALQTILKPFFFASIGFSIPIAQMFSGSVVWRGLVYTILMILGKLFCGGCLLHFTVSTAPFRDLAKRISMGLSSCRPWPPGIRRATDSPGNCASEGEAPSAPAPTTSTNEPPHQPRQSRVPKPMSLYPATLLGSAMVARGEIGFFISSVAETDGVFGSNHANGSSELFLIVTWAILLCTLLGPIAVGLMVKRVKRLQAEERKKRTGREDPLGIWGVVPDSSQPSS